MPRRRSAPRRNCRSIRRAGLDSRHVQIAARPRTRHTGKASAPPAFEVPEPAAEPSSPRKRPAWVVPTAIAAIGVIASGTLGYFLYVTAQQRDGYHQKLVSTSATLAAIQSDLTAAQSDAATRR